MLEFDDIQHILLTRAPALTGRYEFLSFRNAGGRTRVARRHPGQGAVGRRHAARRSTQDARWVTVAFTWNGLRALGVDEASLATFPEEFRQGMVARAEMLGDTGANHPDHWVGGLASPDLHAIVILFARDDAERERCRGGAREAASRGCEGVEVLSTLDLEATPPFDYAHDHFGYRDRLSQPVIEGSGDEPTPGSGAPLKAGEFILGYPDENGPPVQPAAARDPLAQRQLHGLSPAGGARRRVPRLPAAARRDAGGAGARRGEAHGPLAQRRAARAGAGQGRPGARRRPAAQQRLQLQAAGSARLRRAARLAHAAHEPARHRREHEPPPHDPPRRDLRPAPARRRAGRRRGARHRGVRDLREPRSASSSSRRTCGPTTRTSTSSATSAIPIIGNQDGTLEFKIPKRPIRKTITGLPAFTTVRGGAYFFLPGLKALRYLAALGETSA